MKEFTCIVCPMGCHLTVKEEKGQFIVSGNSCPRGKTYGINEMTNPVRTITTTIRINGACAQVVPVKTSKPIPKSLMMEAMKEIAKTTIEVPVKIGDKAIKNILNTGSDILITKNMDKVSN